MRKVLIAYSTKRGATREIAEAIAAPLSLKGFVVTVCDVRAVEDVREYDAVIVGSAIYMARWMRPAVRFLKRHRRDLQRRPVWLFQDGPLGDDRKDVEQPLPRHVAALARQIHVLGIRTFGGRLTSDAEGFIASRMTSRYAGDFRDFSAVGAWASGIATTLSPHNAA